MKIVACFISDRDPAWYLDKCIESFSAAVDVELAATHIVDDRDHKLGMSGAVDAAWKWACGEDADYLCHVEEDFLFRGFPVEAMVRILENQPHLAQVVLKRDPWSPEEFAAGGQIETDPGAYEQFWCGEDTWVEHDKLFSLNPTVIPRRVLELGVPVRQPLGIEAEFTAVCKDKGYRFAYYGGRHDEPLCSHEGLNRGGTGWSW